LKLKLKLFQVPDPIIYSRFKLKVKFQASIPWRVGQFVGTADPTAFSISTIYHFFYLLSTLQRAVGSSSLQEPKL